MHKSRIETQSRLTRIPPAELSSPGGGSGDVVGPSSVTDNTIVLFDGTTGKLIKASNIVFAANNMTFGSVNPKITGSTVGSSPALTVDAKKSSGPSTVFILNSDAGAQADLWVVGDIVASGGFLLSSIATGTAPVQVTSTTLCTNLNADLLDGQHGSYYQSATNLTSGTLPGARLAAKHKARYFAFQFVPPVTTTEYLLPFPFRSTLVEVYVQSVGGTGATLNLYWRDATVPFTESHANEDLVWSTPKSPTTSADPGTNTKYTSFDVADSTTDDRVLVCKVSTASVDTLAVFGYATVND